MKHEEEALVFQREKITNSLKSEYELAKTNVLNAKNSIKTQEENMKQVDVALKVLTTSYETGRMDFEQIIELQQLKLKFQLQKVAHIKNGAIQQAKMNFLTK